MNNLFMIRLNQLTVDKINPCTPWIKSKNIVLKLFINNDKVITGGKVNMSKSIQIALINRTNIVLFSNGTIHIIPNKDSTEKTINDLLTKIFSVIHLIFSLIINTSDLIKEKDIEFINNIILINTKIDDFINKRITINKLKDFIKDQSIFTMFNHGILNLSHKVDFNMLPIQKYSKDMALYKKIKIFKNNTVKIGPITNSNLGKIYINEYFKVIEQSKNYKNKLNTINPLIDDISYFQDLYI